MASPDEARVDEARDQSPVSDSPPTSTGPATSSDESTTPTGLGFATSAQSRTVTPPSGCWTDGPRSWICGW